MVDEESCITDCWILDHITPHMARCGIPREVCLILGRAMLWRMFDSSGDELVPAEQKRRIMERYADIPHKTIQLGVNPVKKVPLIVDGFDAEVLIETAEGVMTEDGEQAVASVPRLGLRRQEIRLLASQVQHLRTENAEQRLEHERQMQVSSCAWFKMHTLQLKPNSMCDSCCVIKSIG